MDLYHLINVRFSGLPLRLLHQWCTRGVVGFDLFSGVGDCLWLFEIVMHASLEILKVVNQVHFILVAVSLGFNRH